MKSIESEWQDFTKLVFRKMTPSRNQYDEMKKAFFAGAYSLVVAMEEIGEPEVSEDAAFEFLEGIKTEGQEFGKRMLAEYAETN